MTKEEYSKEFLAFWWKYPPRWIKSSGRYSHVGKDLAWKQWRKLSVKTQQYIWSILPVYVKSIPPTIIPDAWRWLRDKKWLDYEPAEVKPLPQRPVQPEIVPVSAEKKAELAKNLPKTMQKRLKIRGEK
ncbi:hypothetical protein LCGC14_2860270 [marine sediment metagenome]|uniref:Uncharacterized protein n=1 Tax=marine sediment metagenome TaxID=412755 RepID=A0A0F9AWX5_9ZZZZ